MRGHKIAANFRCILVAWNFYFSAYLNIKIHGLKDFFCNTLPSHNVCATLHYVYPKDKFKLDKYVLYSLKYLNVIFCSFAMIFCKKRKKMRNLLNYWSLKIPLSKENKLHSSANKIRYKICYLNNELEMF